MNNQRKKKTKNWSTLFVFCSILMVGWFLISQTSFGEKNFFEDQDGDDLSDQEEELYGTDSTNPDTDGDGYSDGAEVASGYNPLKSAPGDKIIVSAAEVERAEEEVLEDKINLTDQFLAELESQKGDDLEKINSLINNPEILQDEEAVKNLEQISLTNVDINEIVEKVYQGSDVLEEIELISEEEVDILEKPTGSEEEIKKEEKKQIEEYLILLGYIFSIDLPIEADTSDQLSSVLPSFVGNLFTSIQSGNTEQLNNLREKAKKTYSEIRKVSAPYVLKDVHILGISLFRYSLENIKEKVLTDSSDPLAMALTLSKLQGILNNLQNLQTEVQAILKEYELEYIDFSLKNIDQVVDKLNNANESKE